MYCDMYCNIFKADVNDFSSISLTLGLIFYAENLLMN